MISLSIEDGAENVSSDLGRITVNFSIPIQIVDRSGAVLSSSNGGRVDMECMVANRNLHFDFGELEDGMTYTFTLKAGMVANASDRAATNLEGVEISFSTPLVMPDEIDVQPVEELTSENASEEAKALYTYIRNELFLKGQIAVGTMSKYTTSLSEADWVYEQTGRYAALHCFDLMNLTGKQWLESYDELLDNYLGWYNEGGIVAGMWHWRDPSKQTNEFYSSDCRFDLSKIVKSANSDGTYEYNTSCSEYQDIMEDIQAAKQQLQRLCDAKIPVLWRPLHEARGTWFWWGNSGGEACKALWMLLRREMADLNNLIWVWTIQADGNYPAAKEWYPGDENVDLVGVDIYKEAPQRGSFISEFNFAAAVSNQCKVVALSECGAMPDVSMMLNDHATWAYCMPWYGDHSQNDKYNGASYWRKMLTGEFSDYVIDRSETAY